jgi:hypothetical protein
MVVLEGALQMVSDSPDAYTDQKETEFLKAVLRCPVHSGPVESWAGPRASYRLTVSGRKQAKSAAAIRATLWSEAPTHKSAVDFSWTSGKSPAPRVVGNAMRLWLAA